MRDKDKERQRQGERETRKEKTETILTSRQHCLLSAFRIHIKGLAIKGAF